jgi:transposase InsO family protein
MIVLDNGTELTSNAILRWHYIAPGKPMQNGFVERFMYRRPRGRKCFDRDLHRRVRSCNRPVCAAHT